jgi:hypothetical protein
MAAVNIQELRRLKKLSKDNVDKWKAQCFHANAALAAGDHETFARAKRGCDTAIAMDRALETVIGWATGWPTFNGFGIMTPVVLGDAPEHARCVHDDCEGDQYALGLCRRHYRSVKLKKAAKPRVPCVGGRRNHSYDIKDVCVYCKRGRGKSV